MLTHKNTDDLKKEGQELYAKIKSLFTLVNTGNKISRNRICLCGSGKKWKKCCLPKHEAQTLVLENMVKEYKEICLKVRKSMKDKIV